MCDRHAATPCLRQACERGRAKCKSVTSPPQRGLPPRIYLPVLAVVAIAFLAVMFFFLRIGFGVTGSAFGAAATPVPADTGGRSTR